MDDARELAFTTTFVTVACPYRVTFERWVTPEDAERHLLRLVSLLD